LKGLQILFKWPRDATATIASYVKKFCREVAAPYESTGIQYGHRLYGFDSFLTMWISANAYAYSHLIKKPKQY